MSKKVIIIGAGENMNVVANSLKSNYEVIGFLDDHKKGPDIIGIISDYMSFSDCNFFISIGGNENRKKIFLQLKAKGIHFINAIHPTALCEKSVTLGQNIFIGAMSYVNVNSKIGDNVFINNACIIEHDNTIGAHSHCAPGVVTGGGASIGEKSFIGLGAVINDHIKIGDNVVIGSGSVVISDIEPNSIAVGIPAKVIKKI